MIEKAEMPAVGDDEAPSLRAIRRTRGGDQRVVGGEDGELVPWETRHVVGRTERHEPAHPAAATALREHPRRQATQAVPDHVDVVAAARRTRALDHPLDLAREAMIVESRRIGEAREITDATSGEEAPQDEEVGRVAEE